MRHQTNRIRNMEREVALREFEEMKRSFERRSNEELNFFAVGYWPENGRITEPSVQKFAAGGFKTTIIVEQE